MLDSTLDNPSQWPSEFAPLKKLDELLRCPVCLEFMTTAMILPSCTHTYCSYCIRKHLTNKECCPSCESPSTPADLRNNRLLDELIVNFKASREQLIALLCLVDDEVMEKVRRNLIENKVSIDAEEREEGDFQELPLYRDPNKSAVKDRCEREEEEEKVLCPKCCSNFSLGTINLHLDSCLEDREVTIVSSCGTPPPCSSSSANCSFEVEEGCSGGDTSGRTRRKRIVLTTSLNHMNSKELKSKASKYGLSLDGSKTQLVNRIKEFLLLYNSRCDGVGPLNTSSIAREVAKKERNLLMHGTPYELPSAQRSEQESIDFNVEYSRKHEVQYQLLIKEIKERLNEQDSKIISKRRQSLESETGRDASFVVERENKDGDPCIEISDNDECDDDIPGSVRHSRFGYVPAWFDKDLLKSDATDKTKEKDAVVLKTNKNGKVNNKDASTVLSNKKVPRRDSSGDKVEAKGKAKGKEIMDKTPIQTTSKNVPRTDSDEKVKNKDIGKGKGIKRKSSTSKLPPKKKDVQSNVNKISSYFSASNKTPKSNVGNNSGKQRVSTKNNSVLVLEDSDDDSDCSENNMKVIKDPSGKVIEDPDANIPHLESPLFPQQQRIESPQQQQASRSTLLDASLDNDDPDLHIPDKFNSTPFAEMEKSFPDGVELSPVLFKEHTKENRRPQGCMPSTANLNERLRKDSGEASNPLLSMEISELVEKAIKNPEAFNSDSECENDKSKDSTHPQNMSREKENTQNVIPAAPSDFFFSQVDI